MGTTDVQYMDTVMGTPDVWGHPMYRDIGMGTPDVQYMDTVLGTPDTGW